MNRNEFVEQYGAFVKQALSLAEKARREGLLMLEGDLDQEKVKARDIFEYGIKFVVDGIDSSIIERILCNIIDQEKDEYVRRYKTIQKEAVLMIQQGFNPEILFFILNSFTDISLNEDIIYAGLISTHPYESTDDPEDDLPDEASDDIVEDDPGLAESIANQTFVFNDIVRLNNPAIQKILRETDPQELAKALKLANEEARAKIYKNLSKRAAAMLKEDMEYMGPVRRSDAEEAQRKIIDTIMQLAETGEIYVG